MSSVLSGDPPPGQAAAPPPATPPSPPGSMPPASAASQRNNTLTVLAGVGVLLLAMGVGVLIGRSGSPKQSAAPAQVISVASPTSSAGGGGEAAFTGDWPAGTTGYTVQLQTLAEPGTSASAVEAAKSAASAKGAKSVGALKSEEFASLSAGSYVVYSGVYHKKGEAEKALSALKKSFPAAKVIEVSNRGGSSTGSGSNSSKGSGSGSSSSPGKPAKVAPGLKGVKGKTYEEKSKNVPNEVEF
jgi:hypothetical protein